jgi:hypothetical protein
MTVSIQPYQNPTSSGFRGGYTAGPPGLPDARDHTDVSVDSRAWTAFTLGLLSVVFSILAGIPAIFVGAHSLRRLKADPALRGRGIAWAGIALGCLSVLAFVWFVYLLRR